MWFRLHHQSVFTLEFFSTKEYLSVNIPLRSPDLRICTGSDPCMLFELKYYNSHLLLICIRNLALDIDSGILAVPSRKPIQFRFQASKYYSWSSTMRAWKSGIDPASKTEEIFFDNGDTLPARFNVDSRDIKEGKKIGQGTWTVREAEWLGRKVAVKKFDVNSTFHSVSLTSREVNRMLSLRHPNVLKLLGFYLTTQKEQVLECTMIMELMDCDLEDYIGRGALSDDQVVYITAEVARGMKHIQKKGCFHRDLKPKNVLLRKSVVTGFNVDVKIADFGSSELMGVGDVNRIAGTFGYKAPEQFDSQSKLFPDKVDVFGFGALCFKILTGKEPYESPMCVREVMKRIDRAEISQRNLPEDVVQMIWDCLDVNPESRPDFEEISCIWDRALSVIREKMARPLPLSTSSSLLSRESMSKGVQGHDHFESMHNMGLSKEYGVHFIPFEELLVIGLLAQGSYGSIYKVVWKGILYAQKILREPYGSDSTFPMYYSYLGKTYFQTFPKLFHKNIVTFMGYSITLDNRISIIMELQTMDLSTALDSRKFTGRKPCLDIQKKMMIVREIAEGMKYLHDQGVVHGDLKPENVVLSALDTDKMTVKLIDFASDIEIYTPQYGAPERLELSHLGLREYVDVKKCDVYSFGILCQEILAGAPSFQVTSRREFCEAVLRGERPPIPIGTSLEMECLIKSCWNKDPHERPDFSEICKKLSGTLHYQSCLEQNNPECFALRCRFL